MEDDVRTGSIKRVGDSVEARLERVIQHDRNTVWRMLTEPLSLAQWLAPGSIDLRPGGAVHIDFADSGRTIESTVIELDAPRLLAYSWSQGDEPQWPLRWELDAVRAGTRLLLTLRLPATEDIAKACAGFDAHLEMLVAMLEGVPIRFPLDFYLDRRRIYGALQRE